jgi:hypothetical protein
VAALPPRNKLPARAKPAAPAPEVKPAAVPAPKRDLASLRRTPANPSATKSLPGKPAKAAKPLTGAAKKAAEKTLKPSTATRKSSTARKPAPASTSTDLTVTDTLPWPDWTHPERNAVRSLQLAPLQSRAPWRQWWERHDLWWSDELFGTGNPTWRVPGKRVWTDTISVTGQPARRRVHIPEFEGKPSTRSAHTRDIIAALLQWHHATARQLAALCGHHPTNFSGRHLKPLYQSGVIERGRFSTTPEARNVKHDYCYRLRLEEPLWRWLDSFDDDTWNNITYGVTPTEPRNHVRHNLMAFEIGLRIMEAVPNVTAVYGERVTSMRKLLGVDNKQHGDMGVVRSDGLRIVVELIHEQFREGFSKKIASWGRALTANGTVNDHGTVVVFVVAPKSFGDVIGEARKRFREALTPDGLTDPVSGIAADPNRVANARLHIFFATWPDWFPGPHAISTEFTRLTGWRLNARDEWTPVDLADPTSVNGYPFTPKDPLAWSMPAQLTHQLYAQPFWLGDERAYQGPPPQHPGGPLGGEL